MTADVIRETLLAAIGTSAFALLYSVPKRLWGFCALSGGTGWLIYRLMLQLDWSGQAISVFTATVAVAFLSRYMSIGRHCPATVFVMMGIIPLVPGVGIYWATYYVVTGQLSLASEEGFAAVKVAIAIVLGIMLTFEIPGRFFVKIRTIGRVKRKE